MLQDESKSLSLFSSVNVLISFKIKELAHTREHNHGAGFWKLLDQITDGNARQLDKEMKNKQCGKAL